jgi:hypothetical protein
MPWLCAGLIALPAFGQEITQTFTLRPGWNAVYIEVEPANRSPAVVFKDIPVASVWTWGERMTAAEFIQDPSEASFNSAGWLGWFAPDRPEAFLSNLHAVQAQRSYLIKVDSAQPLQWSVTGRPAIRNVAWAPDAYNLRGFSVDHANPPTFLSYFRNAAAHYDAASGVLEPIYRLSASGQWVRVNAGDRMRRGEACWVFSRGASDFMGPIEVRLESGDRVDFDVETEQIEVEFRNRMAADQALLVQLRSASIPGALAYRRFDAAGGYDWPDLPANLPVAIAGNGVHRLRLAIRRGVMTGDQYTALIEVADSAGGLFRVPVLAQKPGMPGLAASPAAGSGLLPAPHPLRGLWVGTTEVGLVNEINSTDPAALTPVQNAFPMRLLLHVDAAGNTRFLKEVIQMWREVTYTNDASGRRVVAQPGGYVLLTDDRLIGEFQGATMRDGVPVGRRLSTASYDFAGDATNYLEMSGAFAVGNRLSLAITIGPNFPTNPFRHRYHPDHDNLDERFRPLTNNFEAYPVTREIELEFSGSDPSGASSPDFGYSMMGGTYHERIVGLHKQPIRLQGTFRLTRASHIAELNPSPTR